MPPKPASPATDAPDEALRRIDAWLCDLKDFAIKDGLHIYGRARPTTRPIRTRKAPRPSATALIAALDGRHVTAGPAGAPARGRTDVLPTGRNLFTADPRTMPTPTAFDIGEAAADEVLRRYMQDHGDWPRSLVIDLWGSASLRTGGEEIAQGLCADGLPAAMGRRDRPRHRHRGAAAGSARPPARRCHLAHLRPVPRHVPDPDRADRRGRRAVAARDEDASENPLAEAARAAASAPARIFGSSPGTYGAGPEELLSSGDWAGARRTRPRLSRRGLACLWRRRRRRRLGRPAHSPDRIAEADLLVHSGDDPGRDILEGSADVAFIGGFSAAVALLGGKADVIVLDTTDPQRPRPRSVTEAVTRVVRARAINPRFIEGQMRHGPRGASEFAETVDRLIGFAETTNAIPGALIEAVHDAYVGDETVRAFMLRENPGRRRSSPSASPRRGGAACGIRCAIPSTTISRR